MSDEPKVLQRVKDLIALTASDREEEARSSALIACRLIREHGLVVMGKLAAEKRGGRRDSGYRERGAGEPARPQQPRVQYTAQNYTNDRNQHYDTVYGPPEGAFRRGGYKADTRILSAKQFATAVAMAHAYKEGRAKAHQFFSQQEVEKVRGSRLAIAYLELLKEILG